MKPSYRIVACLASLALAASVPGCNRPTAAETNAAVAGTETGSAPSTTGSASSVRVVAGAPQRKTLTLQTSQPGRIVAFEETPLHPRVSGYVDAVLIDIGDRVDDKQVLIRLDVPELQDEENQMTALVAQAEADVQRASAAVTAANAAAKTAESKVAQAKAGRGRTEGEYQRWKAESERIAQLVENGSVTRKLLDETLNQLEAASASREETEAAVASAEAGHAEAVANIRKAEADQAAAVARVRVANANLARTTTMLGFAEIKAPFAGVVTRRTIDTGHFVQPASGRAAEPLLVVSRMDKVRVAVDIPELEAALVDAGETPDTATIRVQALNVPEFKNVPVSRTGWSLDGTNRSLRVEIDLENESGLLRPGMYSTVTLLLAEVPDALVIPTTAVIRDGAQTYCAVVVNGKIDRRAVELGLRSGGEVAVNAGLTPADVIVVTRPESFAAGQAVEVIAPGK